MSPMHIEDAGYASAKACIILGLTNLFTKGSGKSRRASTHVSTIAPITKPAYNAIFSGDSFRRSVGGCSFFMCSITFLFFITIATHVFFLNASRKTD
jgi:hypothetical protein